MRYVIFKVVFCTESESGLYFFPEHQVFEIFLINLFLKNHKLRDKMLYKFFFMKSNTCHSLRFLMLKKCKKNLGFRLSPFERYRAEILILLTKFTISVVLTKFKASDLRASFNHAGVIVLLNTCYKESSKGKCTRRMRNSPPLYYMQQL